MLFFRSISSLSRLQIAVIGSGISGLSCAWLLSEHHDVTLIEADNRIGGHAHTVDVALGAGVSEAIDTGFIVFNETAYPNFTALLDHLNVARTPTDMSFAVSLDHGNYEYSGNSLATLLGQARQWFDRQAADRARNYTNDTTLGQFLQAEGYSQRFAERHILPMAGAIWSASPDDMMAYPLQAFLKFFANHGLLELGTRPLWQTVVGGSRTYVRAMCKAGQFVVASDQPITRIMRHARKVEVWGEKGFHRLYDHVVVATHAPQALALLADASADEIALLGQFTTRPNPAILHQDRCHMPRSKRLWSAWNYLGGIGKQRNGSAMTVTYWMNALQKLKTAQSFFVTLNPASPIARDKIEREFLYHHPVFNTATQLAQHKLWSLQGQRNTWFCGAWFGAGFHEDGLQAGLAVAEQLGGVRRPWTVANESARIHVTAPQVLASPQQIVAAE
jgi:uncharacterized protein